MAPNEYDVRRNPDLAHTYRMIAEGGRDAFYDGPIAKTIDAYFKRIGGWLSAEDLREHHAEWVEPLVTKYRGVDVYGMPANTQGLATLQMLNIIENFDLRGFGFQSPQSLQVQIEAKRLAYEDRARYYADPHFAKIPIEWLNSKEYAKERAKLIRLDRILSRCIRAQAPSHGDTTYFTTADKDGMMVSIIQSNFRGMGSGLVADGLGLHVSGPRAAFQPAGWTPEYLCAGQAAVPDDHSGICGARWQAVAGVWRDGRRHAAAGTDADHYNRVDYGLDVQAAADSPRWHHEGSSQSMGEDRAGTGADGDSAAGSGRAAGRRARRLSTLGWPMGAERWRIRAL